MPWRPSALAFAKPTSAGEGRSVRARHTGPTSSVSRVSIATTNRRAKGGQFVLHAEALPGNPYDGHSLARLIEETQALTGREIERGVHGAIKHELRRRSAIEPVIGHMKSDGHLGRNFLKGRLGNQLNALLAALLPAPALRGAS